MPAALRSNARNVPGAGQPLPFQKSNLNGFTCAGAVPPCPSIFHRNAGSVPDRQRARASMLIDQKCSPPMGAHVGRCRQISGAMKPRQFLRASRSFPPSKISAKTCCTKLHEKGPSPPGSFKLCFPAVPNFGSCCNFQKSPFYAALRSF